MTILLQPFSTPSYSRFPALPAPRIAGFLLAPRVAGLLPAHVGTSAAEPPLRAARVEILLDRDDTFPTYEQIIQAIGPIRSREEIQADLLAIWYGAPRKARHP